MQFDVFSKPLSQLPVDCLVVGIHLGSDDQWEFGDEARLLDRAADGALARLLSHGDFPGRAGETLLLPGLPKVKATRILLVGQGSRASLSRRAWRKALQSAVTALARTQVRSAAVALSRPASRELDDYHFGRAAAEIVGAALYRVNDLKTGKKPRPPALEQLKLGPVRAQGAAAVRRGLLHGNAIGVGARTMRDLANLPSNVCNPSYIGARAEEIAARYPTVSVRVLDEEAIRKEKMGCFLAVAQGSEQPPRFIVLEHKSGRSKRPPVVLVGKGITFDTGGISLKDPGGMDEMKFDMSGAAAVLGALTVAAELALPMHLVVLVPTCENMPSGRAIKPGDIVTSAAGLSVEILNTDAEGRLILCDAMHYARRFEPDAVVDVATLTGACVVALGAHHSGLMSNDDALAGELLESGLRADDRAWRLPLTEEYGEQLKSNFADFANVAGRDGGAITAAAFLAKFAQGLKWAHLDIAGSAYLGGAQKGSTGRPVGLLSDFLIRRAGR
jgi:leucyl aminopeptidase